MATSFSRFVYLGLILTSVAWGREIRVETEKSIDFALRPEFLGAGHIQFFHEIIDRERVATEDDDFLKVRALDRGGVYEPGEHHVVIARSAYVVDQPIGFFSKERLTDLDYIDEVTGFDDFVRPSGFPLNHIRKKGKVFAPSMDFVIHTYTAANMALKIPEDRKFYETVMALEKGMPPPAITLEYDYRNFGRIFFAEIIAGARTVVHHFPFGENRTLVVSTMLNILYRLPPSPRVLEKETRERSIDLILRTERYEGATG